MKKSESKESGTYNLCYIFSGGYEHIVAVSILSACQNNKNHSLHFHLIMANVEKNKEKYLSDLIRQNKQEVSFYDISKALNEQSAEFNTHGWHPIILSRLKIGEYLPSSIDRVLYLDGDTVILGDIGDLYGMDLEGNIIGMSAEPTIDLKRIKSFNLGRTPYCNSGVMLIDLKKWRQKKSGEKIVNFYINNHDRLFAADQDAIMCIMKDSIKIVEPRYNFSDYYFDYPYEFFRKRLSPIPYFSKEVYEDCKKNPIIVHFIGECKPWRDKSPHPFAKEYDYYASQISITPNKQPGWGSYFTCWKIFNYCVRPFPGLRLSIINKLIPVVRKVFYKG